MDVNDKGNILIIVIVIVVVIVGLITAIKILNISKAGINASKSVHTEAANAKRRLDIEAIATALEENYGTEKEGMYSAVKPEWFSTKLIPIDPNGNTYIGIPNSSASSFNICATLVDASSTQYCISSKHK